MALDRERWKTLLLTLVAANLVGGLAFVLTAELVPSWIVYPIFLVVGCVRLVRGGGTTGIVFLAVTALVFIVVHFPFSAFGPEGSGCKRALGCEPAVAWVTLSLLPLALLIAGALAWRDVRRS